MNQSIWKYPLKVEDEQIIEVPYGAEFLSVQAQHDQPCLWAKVAPGVQEVSVKVVTVGTGHPAQHTEGMQYVGSYQLHGGGFVGHVFIKAS